LQRRVGDEAAVPIIFAVDLVAGKPMGLPQTPGYASLSEIWLPRYPLSVIDRRRLAGAAQHAFWFMPVDTRQNAGRLTMFELDDNTTEWRVA
jgi:hypothetical protein